MPTNKGKRNADLEAACSCPKRGVLAVATTATLPRRSGQGTAPTAPAAAVTGTGGAAAAVTGPAGAAAAAVNTSSWRSGRNTIAVSDAAASTTSSAPNPGGSINATSSGHSQPTATSSGHSQPSINTGHNLDIHHAASLPVPAILAHDNISVYSSSEDDSSVFVISTKKTTSNNKGKSNPIQRPTGGAAKKDSQSSPRRFAAATSLVNLTVGCQETEGNGDIVLPAIADVLPAIDEAINEMFPPLWDTVADDIEVVGFARKEPPLFQVEGVVAACKSYGSDMDKEFDEEDSGTKHSGNKVGGRGCTPEFSRAKAKIRVLVPRRQHTWNKIIRAG
jgi:hypothetical protein